MRSASPAAFGAASFVPRDSSAIVASSRARARAWVACGSARSAAATIAAACPGSSERVQIAGTS